LKGLDDEDFVSPLSGGDRHNVPKSFQSTDPEKKRTVRDYKAEARDVKEFYRLNHTQTGLCWARSEYLSTERDDERLGGNGIPDAGR
jgi:hypothetical protein